MAIRTWSSLGSNDLNLATNYSGAGALLTTDDLVFDGTSVIAATASANLDVKSITVAAAYTGNMSFSGFTAIYENGNASFDGIGTLNLGNGITLNGASSTLHIGAGVAAVTATSCAITMNGTTAMIIDIDKTTVAKSLILGNGAIVTNSGVSYFIVSDTNPFVMGTNSRFTNSGLLYIRLTASGNFMTLGSGYIISGATALQLEINANSITGTVPAVTTQNTPLYITENGVKTGYTILFGGTINTGTGRMDIVVSNAGSSGIINFNNQNVICGNFYAGNANATATSVINYGSGTFSVSQYAGSSLNLGSCTQNFQSSQWLCSGGWIFGSNHIIVPGASQVTITNTATITSNGKSFYDFVINAAGKTITLADALSVHDYTKIIGTQAGNFNTTCSGDALFSVSTTLFRLIMTKATTRTITVVTGGTLTLTNLTDTNVNGTPGALTRWRSTTPGTQFNITIPAPITLTYQNPSDCVSSQTVTVTDGTSANGGNNFRWLFNVVITSVTYLGNGRWLVTGSGFMPAGVPPTATIGGIACAIEAGATDASFVAVQGAGIMPGILVMTVTNSGGQVGTIKIVLSTRKTDYSHISGQHIQV